MEQQREDLPYYRWGIATGALGASTVAVFFLLIDMIEGRPLATPNALGATLFLGEPFDLSRGLGAALIAGYTALHLGIFVGLALVVAIALFGRDEQPTAGVIMTGSLTAIFLVGTVVLGFGFRALSGVSLWDGRGVELVLLANVLASLAMASLLVRALQMSWTPSDPGDPG